MNEETSTVAGDNVALPGPHPHESADFREWAGNDGKGTPTRGLPEGIQPFGQDAPASTPQDKFV